MIAEAPSPPRPTPARGSAAARYLGRMPRIIASAQDLHEVLRRSAELVAEAIRADAVAIRLGGPGGTEIVHVRRPWGEAPAESLPTRLGVPLVLRGRRLGMLTAYRARRRPFSPKSGALIGAFRGPIAMAVDNARLFDALQDRLADVARLAVASEAVAALGDLDTVVAQIAHQAADLLGAERAAVLLVDPKGEEVAAQPPGHGLRTAQIARLRYPLSDDGAAANVLRGGRPFIANDAAGDRRDPTARLAEERSVLMVALRAARASGVLRVSDKRHGLFTLQDARLLGVFAAQAAVAWENAQLYQAAVREREQLLELERLKSQFLQLVSHELRTPLASIKASAEVLLSTAPADLPEAHLRLLRNVDRSSDRLSALIADLLDLVRLEGGRLELDRERLDPRRIAEEAVATVRPLAQGRGQKIRLNLGPDAFGPDACVVDGDRRRLEQIVMNLLTNAVTYGPPGSSIWLTVNHEDGDRVRLEVRDDGPGIPVQEQPLVFERFYRGDGEATRRTVGTGLGLPIARALAELHGGSLELTSEPGRGCTFVLTLPQSDG